MELALEGDLDEADIDRLLVAYVRSSKDLGSTLPHAISMACDKEGVRSLGMMSSALVCPDNQALWLVPQVAAKGCSRGKRGSLQSPAAIEHLLSGSFVY